MVDCVLSARSPFKDRATCPDDRPRSSRRTSVKSSKRLLRHVRLGLPIGLVAAASAFAAVASADDISNTIDASIDAPAEVMPLNVGGADGTTTLIVTPRGSDGKSGCNLQSSETLVVDVKSSHAAVATVSPS